VIFSAGLGGPIQDEYGSFGETTDPIVLAERLDEGLDLLHERAGRGEEFLRPNGVGRRTTSKGSCNRTAPGSLSR
jgi:hypothetical protein